MIRYPGNESATDTSESDGLSRSVNQQDRRTRSAATSGNSTTYTIVVSNAGPSAVSDANVTDSFAADLELQLYQRDRCGGASGNTASGSGDIGDILLSCRQAVR